MDRHLFYGEFNGDSPAFRNLRKPLKMTQKNQMNIQKNTSFLEVILMLEIMKNPLFLSALQHKDDV